MRQANFDKSVQRAPITILVVEDEALIRFVISEALRDHGVSVVEAATADDAWDYLTAGASVDLVFTDNRMPGKLTGALLAARIKQHYPGLQVIMTSSHCDDPALSASFLPKPYDIFATAALLARTAAGADQGETDR